MKVSRPSVSRWATQYTATQMHSSIGAENHAETGTSTIHPSTMGAPTTAVAASPHPAAGMSSPPPGRPDISISLAVAIRDR